MLVKFLLHMKATSDFLTITIADSIIIDSEGFPYSIRNHYSNSGIIL